MSEHIKYHFIQHKQLLDRDLNLVLHKYKADNTITTSVYRIPKRSTNNYIAVMLVIHDM